MKMSESPALLQSRWSLLSTVITIVAIEGSPELFQTANGSRFVRTANWRAVGASIVIMSRFRGTKLESGRLDAVFRETASRVA
jgi:hypothetical protein